MDPYIYNFEIEFDLRKQIIIALVFVKFRKYAIFYSFHIPIIKIPVQFAKIILMINLFDYKLNK